jgi:hypothetical protein
VNSGGFTPTSLAVNVDGTTLYVHYNNSTIASYTGWNGTTATATVISSSVNFNVARIARTPTGTFFLTNDGGRTFGSGSVLNYTMTAEGTITPMANRINISGAIAIDGDGLPIITAGSSGTAVITKLTASAATQLNGDTFNNTARGIAINRVTRVIYVLTNTSTLYVYTPNY